MGFMALAIAVGGSLSVSCERKPAYSEIQTKDSQRNASAEQRASSSAEQPATPAAGDTPANPEQPPETPAKAVEVRIPAFIDERTGEFRDLPSFPKAYRTNAQIGPIGGVESGLFLLSTTEPFQSIGEFYDRAIKKNGWIIVSQVRDPEHLRWELSKGKTSEALVEVKGEVDSNRKTIVLSRAERPVAK